MFPILCAASSKLSIASIASPGAIMVSANTPACFYFTWLMLYEAKNKIRPSHVWSGEKTDFDNGPQFVAKQFVGVLFPDFRHHSAGLELCELVVGPVYERIKRRREDVDVWSPWRGRPCLEDENQDECLKQELFSLSFLQVFVLPTSHGSSEVNSSPSF